VDLPVTRLEAGLANIGKRFEAEVRQLARQGSLGKDERDAIIARLERPENVLPAVLSRELPPLFAPVLEEWRTHIDAGIVSAREAVITAKSGVRTQNLRMRYLNKSTDLPEFLRFADSAQCCFTSKNFGSGVGPHEYVARIWKDPLSFVFHIEDRGDEASDRRTAVGFVFGSIGTKESGEPVLMLNGVYMDRKTDAAANRVLEMIETTLAQPLGCAEQLVASQHGGRMAFGDGYDNTTDTYTRHRALQSHGRLENSTYDDIAMVAVGAAEDDTPAHNAINQPATFGTHMFRKLLNP
jgi:hypothetical protein